MKVGSTRTTRPGANVGGTASVRASPPAGGASGAGGIRAPADTAAVMGVPETELTPKVRAAIAQLMSEVQRLRDELEQASKRIGYLERLSDEDPLLPILNRRAFVRELSRFASFAERYAVPSSVLYFDLKGLKRINDTYGHATGDAALKHTAEVLLRNLRDSDVIGRLGGDEFGVILMQSDEDTATAKAEELAQAIAATPLQFEGRTLPISVNFGVHGFASGESVDEAIHAADRKMYAHKRAGG